MRRFMILAVLALAAAALSVSVAWAGSPHFVSVTATREGNAVIVSGKEAGLGDEEQVHIEVTGTAECINGGENHPKAANKETVGVGKDVPVQNGKAVFEITLRTNLKCSPPMTIRWSNVVVEDTTNHVRQKLGSF